MRWGSGPGRGGAPMQSPPPPLLTLLLLFLRGASGKPCAPTAVPCSCRRGLLDCSRFRGPGRSLEPGLLSPLPPGITALDLSHNYFSSSNWSIDSSYHTLQEVKMNYNKLTDIPYFGELTSNITLLSLVHNTIPEIIPEQLQVYVSLENLDLSSNLISEIKASSFPQMQLKFLNLSNNRITTLEMGCLDNLSSSLIVVKLNRNRISTIPLKTMRLPHMQLLELKRNRIKVIESLTFQGLDSLKSLKMQRNGISRLMDGAFFGLDTIEELELERNNLTEVKKGWLYGLRTLQQLYISENAIYRISPDAWEFCQRLSELDLSYNQLTRLDESAFVGLSLLERLNLSNNKVSHIADGVFKGLSNLQTLDLRNNEISWAIEDSNEAFVGLDRLNKLILQGNQIKSVTKRAFSGLQALEYLDLNNNAITSIQENAFPQPPLKELVLNTSSLLCDCQLKWLLQWLTHNHLQDAVSVSCAHPEWLAGQSILSVNSEDFVCDDFPKPQIRAHPETTIALRGTNVTLTCKAVSSSDSPMSATWRKDSEILYDADIENFVRYQQQDGDVLEYTTVLHVFSVNFTDEGKYQCIISNHFGSNYSNKAKLTVNELPSFLKTPMDLTIRTRAMAKLECAAEGHPSPQISWQKDGGTDFPAARERRMHVMPEDDVFFIVNVKIEDMGIYSCMAQNVAGSLSANATLTVLEEVNLPADIPSYLSSQGTLSEPQEGYSNSEAGSNQQLMPPSNGYMHKGTDGGTGPLVICSDCYDNANIYSRTREYCPYAYITEDDPLDQTLSSLMVQMPKEPYPACSQHEVTALDGLSADRDMSVLLTNHDRIHERKHCSQPCNSDPFQLPLWGINNKDLSLSHPHFSPQLKTHDVPQVLRSEGIAESDHEQAVSPRPHHRLHEHDFDFNRTRNVLEHNETT
ncbi:leucine-rich repeats and immunoglobulin-like domains protein 2 isoform X2 [Hemicordylus capensis]|uniref:leucine-rich repeats and immunoglobulin-like domains protein 2 isoform X2 n=1 Tax=Hemicordylus capensis TaxID=884348 RepID=UPI0023038F5C|nr:leucine-rich repeats and immunoglobulin-like domains protein 2 isoform X2 [Hemicordylus capensis]